MKRVYSSSSGTLSPKQHKPVLGVACLTLENLMKHDRTTPPLSRSAVVDMLTDKIDGLPDVPIILPSSTRSSQQSRSSSPSRPTDAQYRAGHLRRASIFVDEDIPPDVSQYVTHILAMASEDIDSLQRVSDKLWRKCKDLARRPSGETEWRMALHTAIDELRHPGLEIPPVRNARPIIPRKQSQPHQLAQEDAIDDGGSSSPDVAGVSVPIFKLKDSRPDICRAARSFLFDLQITSTFISDSHVTPVRLRFPFIVVEAKSGATGGNLYQAQNQAAVSGSTALRIFQNLADLHDAQGPSDKVLNLAFSVTTEGPIHELWLHFRRHEKGDFCMACVGSWRVTLHDGSLEFVRRLSAVLRWGNGNLRKKIVGILQEI
ncbi:uncharacterized protein BO80DRAFT_495344 [Aspergillus ibericus CBS 121593]|uniref:DUF7924 domain-containing protein n=1 Tax=Aspergillus ibericus CBS 121593 TaxID=1448316 RepID=A0A395GUW9_9EURO|nr:hypothetical protein BO80DRAFT_495344 [Aspergillus ibericus CBS 121593]RAK98808.1 hypothetical protein BO80DRAFT_495344 [Aspergillus ibericus CBS 121593]